MQPKEAPGKPDNDSINQPLRAGDCIRLYHLEMGSWLQTVDRICDTPESDCSSALIDGMDPENKSMVASSHTLWEIEHQNPAVGGKIDWGTPIRLRHVCTGSYLTLGSPRKRKMDYASRSCSNRFDADLSASFPRDSECDFRFKQIGFVEDKSSVHRSSAVRIESLSLPCTLHCDVVSIQDELSADPSPTKDSELGPLNMHFEHESGERDEHAFRIVHASALEVDDTLLLLSLLPVLHSYVASFGESQPHRRHLSAKRLANLERVLSDLIFFCIEADPALDPLRVTGPPHRSRQRLFRYQGFVELLVKVIQAPFALFGGPFEMSEVASPDDKGDYPTNCFEPKTSTSLDATSSDSALMKSLRRVLRLANTLLMHIFRDYRSNELYVMNVAAPMLMDLLGNGLGTSIPLSYLLQENRSIIEKLDTSIMQRFFDLIANRGCSARYLQFLTALCSAGGKGVQKMQETACELLFGTNSVFRDIVLLKTKVSDQELYIKECGEWKSLASFVAENSIETSAMGRRFYGQLLLLAAMCLDRNYSSIEYVRILFPQRMLFLAMTNGRYNMQLRSTLMRLFVTLYVDCEPQRYVDVPDYTRIWNSLSDELPRSASDDEKSGEQFVELKQWIFIYLQQLCGRITVSDKCQNELTLSVVQLLSKLVEFGFYNNYEDLESIIVHLVNLLDGHSDTTSDSHSSVGEISVGDSKVRRMESSIQFGAKTLLKNVRSVAHTRSSRSGESFRDIGVVYERGFTGKILPFSAASDLQENRYKLTEGNRIVMKVKEVVCAILLYVDKLKLDFQISTLLLSLKRRYADGVPTNINWQDAFTYPNAAHVTLRPSLEMFEKVSPLPKFTFDKKTLECKYSLNQLAQRRVEPILLDLVMYDYQPLVSEALELLSQQFNQHDQMLKGLQRVKILTSDHAVTVYKQLHQDVDLLRKCEENTEIWMDLTSASDYAEAEMTCTLLESLTRMMENTSDSNAKYGSSIVTLDPSDIILENGQTEDVVDRNVILGNVSVFSSAHHNLRAFRPEFGANGDLINDETRHLIGSLGACQHVLNLLRGGSHFFKLCHRKNPANDVLYHNEQVDQMKQKLAIRKVFVSCLTFLRVLCTKNPVYQTELAEHSDLLIDFLGDLKEIQELLSVIFVDNVKLCRGVPDDLLRAFISQILTQGYQPRFILFLESVVLVNQEPLKDNQSFVMSLVANPSYSKHILWYFDDVHIGMDKLREKMRVYQEKESGEETIDPEDHELEYHVRLLHLLSACCVGSNLYTENKCQSILPADILLDLLRDESCTVGMKAPLFRFLREVYVDTDVPSRPTLQVLLNIFMSMRNELVNGTISYLKQVKQHDVCSRIQHSRAYDPFCENVDSSTKHLITGAIVPTICVFLERYRTSAILHAESGKKAAEDVLKCLNILFYAVAKESWIASDEAELMAFVTSQLDVMFGYNVLEKLQRMNERNRRIDLKKVNLEETTVDQLLGSLRLVSTGGSLGVSTIDQRLRMLPSLLSTAKRRRSSSGYGSVDATDETSPSKYLAKLRMRNPIGRNSLIRYNAKEFASGNVAFGSINQSVIDDFVSSLQANDRVQEAIREEFYQLLSSILDIEKDESNCSTLSFEQVVSRMVYHVKISRETRFRKMNHVLMSAFCQMIHLAETEQEMRQRQRKLDSLGATELVIFLVGQGGDESLFEACLELGICLLTGLSAQVQGTFYRYWVETGETEFFRQIKKYIDKATDEVRAMEREKSTRFARRPSGRQGSAKVHRTGVFGSSGMKKVLRFLQLLCEGHNLNAQRYLISQSAAAESVNLVQATANYLLEIFASLDTENIDSITQVFVTLTEFCEGPCAEAQETIASYKFLSAINTLMMSSGVEDRSMRQLLSSIVTMLMSLLEGRQDSIIHERLVHELSIPVLKENLERVYDYFLKMYGKYQSNPACSKDPYMSMGFNLYALIQMLVEKIPHLSEDLIPIKRQSNSKSRGKFNFKMFTKQPELNLTSSDSYAVAYEFFEHRTACVEILWYMNNSDGAILTTVYFPIHPICFFLTDNSKQQFVWKVGRGSTKLNEFFSKSDNLICEMQHQSLLHQNRLLSRLARSGDYFKLLAFILALVINALILVFYQVDDVDAEPRPQSHQKLVSDAVQVIIPFLGSCQVIICSMVVICFLLNSAPLLIRRGWQERKRQSEDGHFSTSTNEDSIQDREALLLKLRSKYEFQFAPATTTSTSTFEWIRVGMISTWFLLRSSLVLYYLWFILIAFLGSFVHAFFFSLHLLDVVNRYQDLRNVLRAVYHPRKALLLTVVLYLIVVYVFTIVGFYYFREDFTPEGTNSTNPRCQDLFRCFFITLDKGFKHDGGLGGYLQPRELGVSELSYQRLLYDFLYNVLLIVVLLNIVFGVIIDRFAALRTQHKEKMDDMANRCFICSIDRYTFEQIAIGGFEYHRRFEHNKWHYIYLFAHLREKPMTEYNGKELYLAMRMAKYDVSFFPSHRALAIERYRTELIHEEGLNHIENDPSTSIQSATSSGSSTYNRLERLETKVEGLQTSFEKKYCEMMEKQQEIIQANERIHQMLEKLVVDRNAVH